MILAGGRRRDRSDIDTIGKTRQSPAMPRTARVAPGGMISYGLNRSLERCLRGSLKSCLESYGPPDESLLASLAWAFFRTCRTLAQNNPLPRGVAARDAKDLCARGCGSANASTRSVKIERRSTFQRGKAEGGRRNGPPSQYSRGRTLAWTRLGRPWMRRKPSASVWL